MTNLVSLVIGKAFVYSGGIKLGNNQLWTSDLSWENKQT